jgi:hypothetical protein
MKGVRTVLALALIVVGATIIVRMIHFPFLTSITGVVLGGAMIALGVLRLHGLYGRHAA